jgi:putative serine protease PepD
MPSRAWSFDWLGVLGVVGEGSNAQPVLRNSPYAVRMDPPGAGRTRGFRAPSVGAATPQPPAASPAEGETRETLEVGRPARPRGQLSGRWLRLAVAGVLVIVIALIAALAFRMGSNSAASGHASPTPTPTPAPTATPLPVTDVYRRVVPSVVLITTSKGSLGSGTVVTDTGTVLTANHVISGGGRISMLFADGTRAAATVAATNPKTDTATLTPKKLPEVVVAATLGGGVAVGSDVVAVGNPLGLRDSTSSGIVSGLERRTKTKAGSLSGLIQFDAAVNPGSSGGPLLNSQGLVVGVVVSIADPGNDDAFAGIGFAVPIGTALGGGGNGPGQGGGPQL